MGIAWGLVENEESLEASACRKFDEETGLWEILFGTALYFR
jgi:ADP-ribose pyrophosphatase YjhB (NUDIX family)